MSEEINHDRRYFLGAAAMTAAAAELGVIAPADANPHASGKVVRAGTGRSEAAAAVAYRGVTD